MSEIKKKLSKLYQSWKGEAPEMVLAL